MVARDITIGSVKRINAQGATQIVRKAGQYDSSILINIGSKTVNAKSIMGVLAIGSGLMGTLRLSADGRDEVAALETISSELMRQIG